MTGENFRDHLFLCGSSALCVSRMLVNYSSSSSEEENEDVGVHGRKRQRQSGTHVSPPCRKRERPGDQNDTENRLGALP